MPYIKNKQPELLDKIVAASCYPSCGLIGLLYLLLRGKNAQTAPFFYFHFLQSIVLAVLMFLVNWTGSIMKSILTGIVTLIFALLPMKEVIITATGNIIDWFLMLISVCFYVLSIYGLVFALLGKYAEMPVISALVRRNM